MATYWLRRHSRSGQTLRYSPSTSTFTQHDVSELAEEDQPPRPGTWTEADGRIYGLSPSPNGPVFFCEGDAYLLEPGGFDAKCTRTEDGRIHFVLNVGGETVIEVLYTPEQDMFFDFYHGENESFFEWFGGLISNPTFFKFNTRD